MRSATMLGVFWVVASAHTAFAAVTFTQLADTSGTFSSFARPFINSSGQVAVDITLKDNTKAIYLYSGTSPLLVAQTGSTYSKLTTTSLSDTGSLAFASTTAADSKNHIQAFNGTASPNLYSDGDYGLSTLTGARALNSHGQFAFYSTRSGQSGMYVGNGSTPTLIAKSSDYLTTIELAFGKPFNNNDDFVFSVIGNDLKSYVYIAHADGSAPTQRLQGTSSDNRDVASLNDNGVVAIRHGVGTSKWVETIAADGTVTQVASAAGSDGFVMISLNNLNQVAFFKSYGSGGREIDYTDSTGLHRLIGTGDFAFGSTVTGLNFGSSAYSDNGRLAFTADLANGQSVLAYATVPEPGTVTLLVSVICAAMARRQRRPDKD